MMRLTYLCFICASTLIITSNALCDEWEYNRILKGKKSKSTSEWMKQKSKSNLKSKMKKIKTKRKKSKKHYPTSSTLHPIESPSFESSIVPTIHPSDSPTPTPSSPPSISFLPSTFPTSTPSISFMPSTSPTSTPTSYNCTSLTGRGQDISTIVSSISGNLPETISQTKALDWILTEDKSLPNSCNGTLTIGTRYTLAVFYYSLLGENWKDDSGWLGSGDVCTTWFGITCNDENRVEKIILPENNLGGNIPTELIYLTKLKEVNFFNNQIVGTFPSSIFSHTELQKLDIETNKITGQIFTENFLESADNIINLLISFNEFSGPIPTKIGNFVSMRDFFIAGNQFTGTIPVEMSKLTNLRNLLMYDNDFTGGIPNELGDGMRNLEAIFFHDNPRLGGSIPISIGLMTNLKNIQLHNSGLNGSIPPSIGNLLELREINLSMNSLTGRIPSEMSNLVNLETIEIQSNNITGPLPELSQSSRLSWFDASDNRLSKSIPQYFFDLKSLGILYLSNNRLTGKIPVWDSSESILRDIWLDENMLSGPIPDISPGSLIELNEILLQGNELSGPVPNSFCDIIDQLRSLQADCEPPETNLDVAQNPCDCCTKCFIGSVD